MTKKRKEIYLGVKRFRQLNDFNKARRDLGLPKIEVKTRQCLKCRESFESMGRRICDPCRKNQEHLNHHTPEELYNG